MTSQWPMFGNRDPICRSKKNTLDKSWHRTNILQVDLWRTALGRFSLYWALANVPLFLALPMTMNSGLVFKALLRMTSWDWHDKLAQSFILLMNYQGEQGLLRRTSKFRSNVGESIRLRPVNRTDGPDRQKEEDILSEDFPSPNFILRGTVQSCCHYWNVKTTIPHCRSEIWTRSRWQRASHQHLMVCKSFW